MFAWVVLGVCVVYLVINVFLLQWHSQTQPPAFPDDEAHFNATLAHILKPRFVGSLGHSQVRDFIIHEMQELGFITSRDEFYDEMIFTNIVGVINLEAPNYLMFTCHYDTKQLPGEENFVGATDSAVSCAILLNVAKTLGPYLNGEFAKRLDLGLVFVFFDGHESLEMENDSTIGLYGSRRFAEVETVMLESIEAIITLNFIGAPDQAYMSHYESTYFLHNRMADIEMDLRTAGQLTDNRLLFHKIKDHETDMEDDHYSFLDEGVPVMHLVPQKYPKVWHTAADNIENLHWPTIRNMNAIIRRFVYEYLEKHNEDTNYRYD